MLTNLASYLLGYLEPSPTSSSAQSAVLERLTGTSHAAHAHPRAQDSDSDDEGWLLLDANDENEGMGRVVRVRVSRSASMSSLPSAPLEESWFLTPPPCFTSTPPSGLELEASPLENLLIEHPSMSVYHHGHVQPQARARSASPPLTTHSHSPSPSPTAPTPIMVRQPLAAVVNQQALRCLELKAASKYQKKQSVQVSRNQLDRSNKVREVNARSRRQRRSDRQHQHSGANNNRKCC